MVRQVITLRRLLAFGGILSAVLFAFSAHSGAQAAPKPGSALVPVLMYHYISTPPADADPSLRTLAVTPDHFRQQIKWLHDNQYVTISPDDLVANAVPARAVLLTFDDGYIDAYTNAFPILKEYGYRGTFFIVTDWIDQNRPGYLNWSQVKEMANAGMSIEAHSRTHESMRGRTRDWLDNQIVGSMDAIQAHIGTRPRFFAYPFGLYDAAALKAMRAAGITAAFTTHSGMVWPGAARSLELPRLRMRGTTNVNELAGLMLKAGN